MRKVMHPQQSYWHKEHDLRWKSLSKIMLVAILELVAAEMDGSETD